VLIADDHTVVRQGLSVLLSVQGDIAVAGEAADGAQAVELTVALDPDVLLLDLKLPVLDGVGVLRELRERGCRYGPLVLTSAARPGPGRPGHDRPGPPGSCTRTSTRTRWCARCAPCTTGIRCSRRRAAGAAGDRRAGRRDRNRGR